MSRYTRLNSNHDELSQTQKSVKDNPPSARLHRSAYILVLTLLYFAITLCTWIVTCILAFRLITAEHYGVWRPTIVNKSTADEKEISVARSQYDKNENWYHAARVLQSISSVLTVTLASAVCSSAAVIFAQQQQTLTARRVHDPCRQRLGKFVNICPAPCPRRLVTAWKLLFAACYTHQPPCFADIPSPGNSFSHQDNQDAHRRFLSNAVPWYAGPICIA